MVPLSSLYTVVRERGTQNVFYKEEVSKGKWASCHFGERHKIRWEKEGAERSDMRKKHSP